MTLETLGGVLICPGASQTPRWREGERLDHVFEDVCERMRHSGEDAHLAVDGGHVTLTYQQLDARANQLARHLARHGVTAGDRVGLLFDHPVFAYVAMLAVLKLNSAFVPLDAGFPPDRLSFITRDAGVRTVLSLSHLREHLRQVDATVLALDQATAEVGRERADRLSDAERRRPVDELCYIIYTSGSTGRPKGVAVEHASICNFVRVAVEVYGLNSTDRMFQGMTIAFDFSVEEIWVPLVAGATLVPKPSGATLLGEELRNFLVANEVTALCCVPTLLATIDEDVPGLRFLLVSGEACPQDLVARWHRPDRRFLNVYGPTEATVTATWTTLHPDRPVTIGAPLPTYSVVILDPAVDALLAPGEVGEIGIAGIGLARGYVNRDDLTERSFRPDFIGIEGNRSGRIYRTGDLGRVTEDGAIEYQGRIDTQVKIRGYRVELTEIESILLQLPQIAVAVVDTYEPAPGIVELVGYYSLRADSPGVAAEDVYQRLRDRLPPYMVPAYLEQLTAIPMLPSGKADRKHLPPPTVRRGQNSERDYRAPTTDLERSLAALLAKTLGVERVSVDSDLFDDLGANSLLMARFCASMRKREDLPSPSMTDIYQRRTVRSLAARLSNARRAAPVVAPAHDDVVRVSSAQYFLCGTLQVLVLLGYTALIALADVTAFSWVSAATGWFPLYLRVLALADGTFVLLCAMPILAKWLLVGRCCARKIRLWSPAYFRFWVVKSLVRSSPLAVFVGSPLYVLYLRALGAGVGREVVILSRLTPVCADLLTIGDRTVIRKDARLSCYQARSGAIHTGPITIGTDAFVGEATVLGIDTTMGDGAQLGHSSTLYPGQTIPDQQRWHGTPAQLTTVNYQLVRPRPGNAFRRTVYCGLQLLTTLLVYLPLPVVVTVLLGKLVARDKLDFTSLDFYREQLTLTAAVFFGAVFAGLVVAVVVPPLLSLLIKPDQVYPLYGFHYAVHRAIRRLTNSRFLMYLFGDSAYIVAYLRMLGYDLGRVEQTGSNFGVEVKHETPFLCSVGGGTLVSDGLSLLNAEFSSSSFRVSRVSIGPHNFVGNNIVYPAGGMTGENCLLATKVMIPLDGVRRENVGLLGSPCFEIPRSVRRDAGFDHLKEGDTLRRRLFAKTAHNTVTIGIFLSARLIHVLGLLLIVEAGVVVRPEWGAPGLVATPFLGLVFSIAYFVLVERASIGFRRLRPRFCSIYDSAFWRHERFWKLSVGGLLQVFDGTPVKGVIWRALGVRVGGRLFDDGCAIPEKTLLAIGDDCVLNAGSTIQCHSLEDGSFKSDRVRLSHGCTVGTAAFVHYGVTMGDGAVLDANSFLMKGEELAPRAFWRGNPARQLPARRRARHSTGVDNATVVTVDMLIVRAKARRAMKTVRLTWPPEQSDAPEIVLVRPYAQDQITTGMVPRITDNSWDGRHNCA